MSGDNVGSFFRNIGKPSVANISVEADLSNNLFLSFTNASGNKFSVDVEEVYKCLKVFKEKNSDISNAIETHPEYLVKETPWIYQEKPYRSLTDTFFSIDEFPAINALIRSQTRGFFNSLNAFVCFVIGVEVVQNDLRLDERSLEIFFENINDLRLMESVGEIKKPIIILGPYKTLKEIALASLKYCEENYRDLFESLLIIDKYKIKIPESGTYLWTSQKGIDDKNTDNRVFYKHPFSIQNVKYFLSDQWTSSSSNGRSISSLNLFLEKFGLFVDKTDGGYILIKHHITIPVVVTQIPKPFMLLAGISGTGKTRFVRDQAKLSSEAYKLRLKSNYCLVPVRPDWHEPSDLLGYISRIGQNGSRYVISELLRFIVSAWKFSTLSASDEEIVCRDPLEICPFWLCLDEMNLAPVEQYFADYLSVLETRNWEDGVYSCEPLLRSSTILQLDEDGRSELWKDLGVDGEDPVSVGLREHFEADGKGIPLPPNLIIAGTVNMDETTHGFSRKVIDRALTIDFGEFYPNDYGQFYEPTVRPKPLSYPTISQVNKSDLAGVSADPDGAKTIAFLSGLNELLVGTPFELAYRALNEALLSVTLG